MTKMSDETISPGLIDLDEVIALVTYGMKENYLLGYKKLPHSLIHILSVSPGKQKCSIPSGTQQMSRGFPVAGRGAQPTGTHRDQRSRRGLREPSQIPLTQGLSLNPGPGGQPGSPCSSPVSAPHNTGVYRQVCKPLLAF